MDLQEVEKLLTEQNQLARQTRTHVRYIALALVFIVGAVGFVLALAWKMYTQSVAPALGDMQATMQNIHDLSAQAAALLEEAKQTMGEVRQITGAVGPVIEEARGTMQEVQETTSRVEEAAAPANILRAIPILNWFIQ